jgi:GDP-L-fucose synthase
MTNNFWQGRNVLVTGASGFIGSHITELLVQKGANVTATACLSENGAYPMNLQSVRERITLIKVDLTRLEDCLSACANQEVVVNAAHVDGSVAFKQAKPAAIFRENMLITLQMLEAARRSGVNRFLVMSSAEVYPPDAHVPLAESDGFMGLPDPLTDGYAWSKRMSEFAAQVFARQYGLQVAIARPSNVYGPRDSFDSHKGRVIPTFIKKVFEGDGVITIWGTGEQVRTFLYVEDLARGLLDLIEKYPKCDPVNFGGEEEITIKDLAQLIVALSGRRVEVVCDPTKPSGPLKRTADTRKAKRLLGFVASIPLHVGLRYTIEAYRKQWQGY